MFLPNFDRFPAPELFVLNNEYIRFILSLQEINKLNYYEYYLRAIRLGRVGRPSPLAVESKCTRLLPFGRALSKFFNAALEPIEIILCLE